MSYRLLRITNLYKEYLHNYYGKFPAQQQLNYDEQLEHLINDSVETVSSYGKYLRKNGVDAIDIITNAYPLQRAWAIEHKFSESILSYDLIGEQIKFYKPDVVWLDDTSLFDKNWIQNLRQWIPGILIVGHICAPYNAKIAESFSSFDIMFTCTPCLKKEISKYGVETKLLYHGFNHSILNIISSDNSFPKTDLIFTGSLFMGYGFHKSRIEYIEKLIESGIDISLYGNLESCFKVRLKQSLNFVINFLRKVDSDFLIDKILFLRKYKDYGEEKIEFYSRKLIDSVHSPVFGLDMYKLLSRSKLCFNNHGEIAKKCAGNVRLFEATGVGTCLVTDWKDNLSELFEPEKEVVTYKSPEECIEKVKWLLRNSGEAEKIAKAGQERTLKDHTIEKRALMVNELLKSKLNIQ